MEFAFVSKNPNDVSQLAPLGGSVKCAMSATLNKICSPIFHLIILIYINLKIFSLFLAEVVDKYFVFQITYIDFWRIYHIKNYE